MRLARARDADRVFILQSLFCLFRHWVSNPYSRTLSLQIRRKSVTLCPSSKILLEAEPCQSATSGLGSTRMFFGKDADSPRSADDRRNMRRFRHAKDQHGDRDPDRDPDLHRDPARRRVSGRQLGGFICDCR